MKRVPLRLRVALGYGLMGLLLSVAFAGGTSFLADDYEEFYVAALLDGQADTYLKKLAADPGMTLPRSPGLSLYRESDAPRSFRGLAPGNHEFDLPGHEGVHVGVFDGHGQRLVIVLEVGQIEALEHYLAVLVLAVVVCGTAVSAWLGWLLAARSIKPVARLAKAVEDLPIRPLATQLASAYSQDGVGRLAAAVDRYQARLVDADAREREFFADASHELRTPLAVIQGAVEVLKDDPGTTATQLARLDRIDRSTVELAFLLEALLLSARGMPAETEALDLRDLCQRTLDRMAAADSTAGQRMRIVGETSVTLQAPPRWVACILEVLLHKVLAASPKAFWEVSISPSGLYFFQPRHGRADDDEIRRGDLGVGIVFAERLCRGLDWKLEQLLSADEGLSVRLRLPASADP